MTNDSVTVIHGGKPFMVRRGAPNFEKLRAAVLAEDWDKVPKLLSVAKTITDWAKGKFSVANDTVYYDGQALPRDLNDRIIKMSEKDEDPSALTNFWEKLQKNPSARSVEQLWPFLTKHRGIALTPEGNILAYKGVNQDYTDKYTGAVDNSPGTVNEMQRNRISDDPNHGCHFGFHVGSLDYARGFASRVVICEIDPADVVCIPYDHNHQKMRVCKYKVVGNHNGDYLPDTVYRLDVDEVTSDDSDPLYEQNLLDSGYWEKTGEDDDDDSGAVTVSLPIDSTQDLRDVVQTHTKVPKKFAKLHAMNVDELMTVSLDKLRQYASKGLKIVGASRVLGGKAALVNLILKTR